MGIIMFNGKPSTDFGIVVEHFPEWVYPEKDIDTYHVPGRSGDVIIDHGTYKNVEQPFDIAFGSLKEDYSFQAMRASQWLHSASGYARLETSYDPDHYRMAYYIEEGSFSNIVNRGGRTTINFICKPQRYLKMGEKKHYLEVKDNKVNNDSISNPTSFDSKPLFVIKGSGDITLTVNLTINTDSQKLAYMVIKDVGREVCIDSETKEIYGIDSSGNLVNYAPKTETQNLLFPKFVPGYNWINVTAGSNGTINSVEVIPRWWTL